MTDDHLGLDALAEATAHHPDGRSTAARHLTTCAGCAARLAELREAEPAVRAALAALPVAPIPADIAARLDDALGALTPDAVDVAELTLAHDAAPPSPAPVTTLPPSRASHRSRWLAAAAGLVVVLAGAGAALTTLRDSDGSTTTAARDAAVGGGAAAPVRNETGTDYADRAALAAAIPDLLAGTAPAAAELRAAAPAPAAAAPKQAPSAAADQFSVGAGAAGSADPLARLRTDAGLAQCLSALLPPDEPSVRALALDYGSYRGTPALVVVLPGAAQDKLDVFVVGDGCSTANDSTLFYASVPAP